MKNLQVWPIVRRVLAVLAVAVVALVLIGAGEEPEAPGERERMARFFAQEEYGRMLEVCGDTWSAEQAAGVVYEGLVEP